MSDSDSRVKDGRVESNDDEIHKLRRFALVTALALFVYVVGGGELLGGVNTQIVGVIHFRNPAVLFYLLTAATAYSALRYWHQAIHLSLTRTKIRAHFMKPRSILVYPGNEEQFKEATSPGRTSDTVTNAINDLLADLPHGMARTHCIVIGHQELMEVEEYRVPVAKQLGYYFPGLKHNDVGITRRDNDLIFFSHVTSLNPRTFVACKLEDLDLYLPVIAGGLAVIMFLVYEIGPWIWKVLIHLEGL